MLSSLSTIWTNGFLHLRRVADLDQRAGHTRGCGGEGSLVIALDATTRARIVAICCLAKTAPDNRTGLLVLLLVLLTLGARTAVWRLVLLLVLAWRRAPVS